MKKEIEIFKYRPHCDIDLDMTVYTPLADDTISLDSMENHMIQVIESNQELRKEIADKLRNMALLIENGNYNLKGYIVDFDGGCVEDEKILGNKYLNINWKTINTK